ncbi:MAG: hypothetical protein GX112_11485 [Clostridiaceae bacterium]|nr:hypothetical protein [Clostridiaceae bacterium]
MAEEGATGAGMSAGFMTNLGCSGGIGGTTVGGGTGALAAGTSIFSSNFFSGVGLTGLTGEGTIGAGISAGFMTGLGCSGGVGGTTVGGGTGALAAGTSIFSSNFVSGIGLIGLGFSA